MLPSGADIKIGSYEFHLARGEGAYRYVRQPVQDERIVVWDHDDWSGGEGLEFYDPNQPNRYWYGKANPRIPGSVTAPPDRSQASLTTGASPSIAVFANGAGITWVCYDRHLYYTSDGTTWTAHPSNPVFGVGYSIKAAAAVGDKLWVSAHDGTTRKVKEATTSAISDAVNDVTGPPFLGMASHGGWVYGWTGKTLLRYNPKATLPITQDSTMKVYQPALETLPSTYYGAAAGGADGVFMLYSSPGQAVVHRWRNRSGVDLWNLEGVTAKAMVVRSGIIYVLAEGPERRVELHGMGAKTLQPMHLANVGEGVGAATALALGPGYGNTVLAAVTDGTTDYIYVYDPEAGALSELDERARATDGGLIGLGLYGQRRLSAHGSATAVKVNSWRSDRAPVTGSWQLISPAWDLDSPYVQKQLLGFYVVQKPGSGTVTVYYQLDEDGTWTSAGTTAAADKQKYIDLSGSNITCYTLRVRLDGASGCRVLSVAPRLYVLSYAETWDLRVQVTDRRGSTNAVPNASVLRGYLRSLHTDRQAVTLLDGRRYQERGGDGVGYSTHNVLVEALEEEVGPTGEGTMRLLLRSVNP
jgi:hypothetical protein